MKKVSVCLDENTLECIEDYLKNSVMTRAEAIRELIYAGWLSWCDNDEV